MYSPPPFIPGYAISIREVPSSATSQANDLASAGIFHRMLFGGDINHKKRVSARVSESRPDRKRPTRPSNPPPGILGVGLFGPILRRLDFFGDTGRGGGDKLKPGGFPPKAGVLGEMARNFIPMRLHYHIGLGHTGDSECPRIGTPPRPRRTFASFASFCCRSVNLLF